jgi:hypothetical protein
LSIVPFTSLNACNVIYAALLIALYGLIAPVNKKGKKVVRKRAFLQKKD